MVEQIDSKCKGQIGEDIVNERIKQLAYSKILCNVYGKDITYLIKAYTNLGIAYFPDFLKVFVLEVPFSVFTI